MISYNYPTLFLTEGTTKDILITDGTVTVSGTDYTVTDDTIIFTNEDIESEAFELTQSLCSADQLTFGSCEAAVMKITARKTISTDIRGLEVVLYMIPDGDASKMIQLGVFKIAEDKQSDDHIKHVITAYDAMYDIINTDVKEWYNTELPEGGAGETLADFRDSFLDNFGITAESVTLVNDNRTIRHTIEKDRISGGDIIRAICELNGVFGQITNEGKFRFKSLAPSIVSAADLGHITTSQYSDIEFAEHGFKSIKKVKIIRDDKTIVTSSQTATGNYNTVTIAYNPLVADYTEADLQTVANTLCDALKGHIYLPCTLNAIGNPLHEVGDPIEISTRYNFSIVTYILERRLKGVQALRDTYTANGEEYLSENLNSSYTQSKAVDSAISQLSQSAASSGLDFVETIRNIGFRLLDEPTDVSVEYDEVSGEVSLKWTDPDDIATNEPAPCEWAGTVVVRKEGSAPRHRWDGTEIEDSTTRDEYSVNALVDDTVEVGKIYYYGIFPYDTKRDYRFTKVVSFNSISTPRTTIIFDSGNFNESAVATDFEFENYKIAQGDPIPVDSLSEYYLTKWGLLLLDTNGRAFYQLSDVITCEYRGSGSQHLNSYYDIPIERIYNPQKVVIEAKFNQLSTGDYNLLSVRGYAIVNGERLASNEVIVRSGTEYQEYETDLSGLPYLDYIEISAAEGQPYYRSIYVVSGG